MMVQFFSATVFVGDIRATVSARYTHGISVVNRKAVYGYFFDVSACPDRGGGTDRNSHGGQAHALCGGEQG